mgnify:CR=1 FL=1
MKYETVKQTLRNEIIDGKYKINEKLPTESALMKRFNVSRYTIRRAVGDLENEHYIYRIQGGGMFVQDWQRDWTKSEKNKIIGVISTHMADYIFPPIISGIDSVVTEQGYSMIVGNTLNDHKRERQTILNMLDLQIAGLIIFSLGHTNILGVFQIDDQQGVDRMAGMIKAYQDNNIPTTKSNVIMYQSSEDYEDIIKKVDMMLNSNNDITAIACYNDRLATRVISHLQKQGKQVPTDISVIGFDNYEMAQIISPSLTTANHPKRQLGEDAGKMILKMIAGEEVTSKVYPPTIIKGQSTAPLITKENSNE